MFQVYKSKEFDKWAKKQGLSDRQFYDAAIEVDAEQYEANLGGNVYKKRIAINNQGKRGGARSIVAFKSNEELFLKELADVLLNLTDQQLNKLLL